MRRIMFLNQAPKNPGYEVAEIEALLNSYASAGTRIEIAFPDEYEGSDVRERMSDQSAMNGLHHMMETPSIVRKIFWAAQNGYDAVIGSNTFDPGMDGGRLAVDIPVIGPFRTSLHAACVLADRVGILVRGRLIAIAPPAELAACGSPAPPSVLAVALLAGPRGGERGPK